MIYRLLGPLEIGDPGALPKMPRGRTLALLGALVVNPNRQLSKTDLKRATWGKDEISDAQLYKRIFEVRELLTEMGRRDDLISRSGVGYELRIAEDESDALTFQRLAREAAEAGSAGRADTEIDLLYQALGLWRDPHPLSDVPSEGFYQEIAALERRYKLTAARLFELELIRQHHERILGRLIAIASSYPSDQRLTGQLMIAQYRCGHPIDAGNTYERYYQALGDETGGEPADLVRTLHFAIARGDAEAADAAQAQFLGLQGDSAPVHVPVPRQLPGQVDLVGRDQLVAELAWLLTREPGRSVPVAVIAGAGGIGKTALAVRAAHESLGRYPDGQLYLELRGSRGGVDTSEVLAQFLRALGVQAIPETKAERIAEYRTRLADRRVLVVLDDAADGEQVNDLRPGSPGCAVLVTARRRLPDVSGAHHVAALGPMDTEQSIELFTRVVHDGGIRQVDDLASVQRVVALCDGLPLALRIAGALRARDDPRPTAELADRLATQGLSAFEYGNLSVARTIGAGFDRLDGQARRLFLGFGLLPLSSFASWTAAAVLSSAAEAATAALSQLTASFMMQPVEPDLRYRFHDLTKEYAGSRALAEIPEDAGVVPRQTYQALLTLVRHAHARLYGGDFEVVHSEIPQWAAPPDALAEIDRAPLAWFELERLNIRDAVEHCAALGLVDLCWDLAISAHELYSVGGWFDDWYATSLIALGACRKAGNRRGEGVVLACLNQPALVASRRSRSGAAAISDLERSVTLLTECNDGHGLAIALRTLGNALRRQGHLARPLGLFEKALHLYEASADTVGQRQTLRFIGHTLLDLDEYVQARQMLESAEAVSGDVGHGRLFAQNRYWIGQACLATGDVEAAEAAFRAVLDVYRDERNLGHAYAQHGLGDVAWRQGQFDVADQHFTVAVHLARDGADGRLEGRVWLSRADLSRKQGRPEQQAAALEQAVATFAGCGAGNLEVRALARLAQVLAELSDSARAQAAWTRVENIYDSAELPEPDRRYHRP